MYLYKHTLYLYISRPLVNNDSLSFIYVYVCIYIQIKDFNVALFVSAIRFMIYIDRS